MFLRKDWCCDSNSQPETATDSPPHAWCGNGYAVLRFAPALRVTHQARYGSGIAWGRKVPFRPVRNGQEPPRTARTDGIRK